MKKSLFTTISLAFFGLIFTGCATFRSGLEMRYEGEKKRNVDGGRTSVLFVFSHVKQTVGFDAIPKLMTKHEIPRGFDDIFLDALREFSNVDKYATFTNDAADVNKPERRSVKDSLMTAHDYTVKIRMVDEKYFTRLFLGTLASTMTATLAPVPYKEYFGLEVEVFDHDRKLIATYQRKAHLTKWVQTFMIFAYPFHPEERKREEVYMEFLHDAFRQMESEGILK